MISFRFAAPALVAVLVTVAGAESPPPEPLPIEADWRVRSMAWFDADDEQARRKQMRAITRALRQPCRYCHTPDFTGYTDKRLISQQMMALSAEHGVQCAECHAGRDGLTPLGQTAAPMWALAREKGQFCGTCHVKHRRFEALTEQGQRFRDTEWPAWRKAHGDAAPVGGPAASPPRPGETKKPEAKKPGAKPPGEAGK